MALTAQGLTEVTDRHSAMFGQAAKLPGNLPFSSTPPHSTLGRYFDRLAQDTYSFSFACTMEVVRLFLLPLLLCALVKAAEEELKIEVIEKPKECDRKTKVGDYLSMHYTGVLASNGKKFDSSRDRNSPFEFALGRGQVIQGWDQGLKDMCVGEKRKLTIPAHLGEFIVYICLKIVA